MNEISLPKTSIDYMMTYLLVNPKKPTETLKELFNKRNISIFINADALTIDKQKHSDFADYVEYTISEIYKDAIVVVGLSYNVTETVINVKNFDNNQSVKTTIGDLLSKLESQNGMF